MTRQEIIARCARLDLVVGAGAALVLHGLKATAKDIDASTIDVERFSKMWGTPVTISRMGDRMVTYEAFEIFEGNPEYQWIDGVKVETLEELKRFYTQSGRDKDLKMVELIDAYRG